MQLNLYTILNIPEHIILENNIHKILEIETLGNLNQAVSIVNKFHCYFHFEQSFAYLLCAYIAYLKDDEHSTKEYLTKAIFQDHINEKALAFNKMIPFVQIALEENVIIGNIIADLRYLLSYDKHIKYEKDFLKFAIGEFTTIKEIELLDSTLEYVFTFEMNEASKILENLEYKSHRLFFAQTLIAIYNENLDTADIFIQNAIDSIEASHKNYHQFASSVYLKRAEIFECNGQLDLAKNDRVKSRDLFS